MKLGWAGLPADDLAYVAERVGGSARLLDQGRILITGASGFVGTWLVSSLAEIRRAHLDLDFEILTLARNENTARARLGKHLWQEVTSVISDVNDPWPDVGPISHAVHGATASSKRSGASDSRQVLVTSVLGTQRLIQAIGDEGSPPRVLNLSSGAVYGPQPSDVPNMPESWLGAPSPYTSASPYAEGKRAGESLLQQADREGLLHAIQARLYAFMGPLLPTDEHFAIGNFVADAVAGRPIRVASDGSPVRSYLDARDMAVWLIHLLLIGGSDGPYNVGSPVGAPLREWARLCSAISGADVLLGSGRNPERAVYVPDVSTSCRLGLAPVSTEPIEALGQWAAWLRQVSGSASGIGG